MSDATDSQSIIASISALAEDLASKDVAVYGVAFDYLHFGSWTIETGHRHKRTLLEWDGKEGLLTASVAAVADAQGRKNWKRVAERRIDMRGGDGMSKVFESAKQFAIEFADT